MHEFAVTQSVVDIALESVRQNHGVRLLEIHLTIGNLTGIVEDSLLFYFDALTRDTPAQDARVVVHRQSAVAECSDCGYQAAIEPPFAALCPQCNHLSLRVHGGDALVVDRVILATEPEQPA
jgi:hydrogenase nickel incorporation protein HypA/HybF